MKLINKISVILLIWLFISLLGLIVQNYPIDISTTSGVFFRIPVYFWIITIISPFLLYIIVKNSKNSLISLSCGVIYYFIFYSIGLFFISHPTITDIGSSARWQTILQSISHIGSNEIIIEEYFRWPTFPIFSKTISSIFDIGYIQTINLGFFILLLIIPIVLTLFLKREENIDSSKFYFILPALYITLAFHFINDQFVPQFLGLIYLIITFGVYIKYRREKNLIFFSLIIVFFILTVLSHPFMFVFFLLAVIIEKILSYVIKGEERKTLSWRSITLFCVLLFFLYADFFLAMVKSVFITSNQLRGETWWIFDWILPGPGKTGPEFTIYVNNLYHFVPRVYDLIISNVTKVIVATAFLIVLFALIYYVFKKRKIFEISILIGSFSWFGLGLLSSQILGQRAIQVASIPLAKYLPNKNKYFKYQTKILVVIILISPSLFVANDMINTSMAGEWVIQDYEENIAGNFMDKYIANGSEVLTAENLYPTGFINKFSRITPIVTTKNGFEWEKINFILFSPKLQNRCMYYDIFLIQKDRKSVIYDNDDIKIVNGLKSLRNN